MKYSKEVAGLPWYTRMWCISYKKWKKKGPSDHWELWLLLDFICTPWYTRDTNLKTVYKICKRFEKRFGVDAIPFYRRLSRTFSDNANKTLVY